MGRGQKMCDACGAVTGPRSFLCPSCQNPFVFKPKFLRREKGVEIDWKALKRGDKIRVKQNTGPYSLDADGQKINMGYKGEFNVSFVDDNGIHAHGNDDEGPQSHCYIWMGAEKKNKFTSLVRKAHEIEKLGD